MNLDMVGVRPACLIRAELAGGRGCGRLASWPCPLLGYEGRGGQGGGAVG